MVLALYINQILSIKYTIWYLHRNIIYHKQTKGTIWKEYFVLFGKIRDVIQHCHQKLKLIYSYKVEKEEVGCWDMDWIDLVQHGDRWQALVKAVMNL